MIVSKKEIVFRSKREMETSLMNMNYRKYKPMRSQEIMWLGENHVTITPLLHGRFEVKFSISDRC